MNDAPPRMMSGFGNHFSTEAVEGALPADAAVMAAAVADWRVVNSSDRKMKKDGSGRPPALEMTENPDILAWLSRDEARQGLIDAVRRMAEMGIAVFVADPAGDRPLDLPGVSYLPCAAAPHPMLDCISQITTFYVFAERFAFDLGLDPDSPKLHKEVTETI